MGLDITAYRQLRRVPEADAIAESAGEDDETFDYELWDQAGYVDFYVNNDFPGRAFPIEDGKVYAAAEKFGFRAGSYGGYDRWRAALADLAGYRPEDAWEGTVPSTAPFVELVDFSDCVGTLGPVVCAKLARDFAEFQERADQQDDYWRQRYADWRKAVEMGADNGAVSFH